ENERRVAEAQAAAKAADDARRAAEKLAAEKLAAEKLAAQKQETEKQEALNKEAERKESERKTAEAERQARRSAESPAAALGSSGLRRPASGRVTARFGQTDRSGAESRGLSIAGRAGAPVVSPASGSIMYAGPFRNFGLILIVEHGNGYHSLLAGLGRIDVSVGRHVVAGEPLGALPGPGEADGDVRELYFELRSNGRPVDPERGFADKQGKGHG
ncbi:MAG TPA: peptidoglycan DD-metalloendopeptidase family protein, partial [Azospirillaceae bacterium]|nr:peptidoglycan DD-metalloendopeptidase family protein [Azospirillaceae bacterium]